MSVDATAVPACCASSADIGDASVAAVSWTARSTKTCSDSVIRPCACRVVVAGFSQGGAVALLMLRSDVTLTGVAGLSTWLTLADEQLLSDANKATPLWMAHGTADQIVRHTIQTVLQWFHVLLRRTCTRDVRVAAGG